MTPSPLETLCSHTSATYSGSWNRLSSDQAFLDLIGIKLPTRPLAIFWPRGGPQWDGLGRAASGEVILVEAKAHLNELYSPATGASAESSVAQIRAALAETAQGLGAPAGYDWSKQFYQCANRLAHGYLLDRLNGIPTRLVFLYLIGDADVGGPATRAEWETAIHTVLIWIIERAGAQSRLEPPEPRTLQSSQARGHTVAITDGWGDTPAPAANASGRHHPAGAENRTEQQAMTVSMTITWLHDSGPRLLASAR